MTINPGRRIDRLRERVRTSGKISEADKDRLLGFSDELFLRASEYGDHRHEHLLRRCVRMAEIVGGLADALEYRDATEDIVRWIHREYDNEESNRDYRGALRVFARHATEGDDIPESVDWVSGTTSRNYKPIPDPSDMLHWEEDVIPMINAASYSRDRALISVAWDSGVRSGELRSLSVGDVSDHKHGLRITVDGKKGQRSVTLIPSVPYLQRWLQDHPGDSPDDPLWSALKEPRDLSYQMFRKILNRAAEEAGVNKPVTITNFRKSSASYLASQGVNQAVLESHHGWERGSGVAARYVSVFADDSDREIAKAHGLDVKEEERDPIAPIECPRCGRDTPRDEEFCVWCGQAVTHGAVDDILDKQREARRAILRMAKDDPEVLDEIERLQDAVTIVDQHPSILDDADAFLEAIRSG